MRPLCHKYDKYRAPNISFIHKSTLAEQALLESIGLLRQLPTTLNPSFTHAFDRAGGSSVSWILRGSGCTANQGSSRFRPPKLSTPRFIGWYLKPLTAQATSSSYCHLSIGGGKVEKRVQNKTDSFRQRRGEVVKQQNDSVSETITVFPDTVCPDTIRPSTVRPSSLQRHGAD